MDTKKGIWNIFFTPKDKFDYSVNLCDYNRGCTLATGQLKRLRNVQLKEIACAARSDSPYCHYRLTWDPAPPIFDRIKDFFLFRFQNQKSILAHMEENHTRLQEQYNEAKKLNEQLMVTLKEKAALSGKLQELNINLEAKVAEQTANIRSKNLSLEKTNSQLRESERMKDLLTGALVHDIKNHLFSMTCDVRAINSMGGCPDSAQSILRHTASACSSAMSLAANMLDIGKTEEGKLVVEKKPVDFSKLREILDRYTGNVFFSERNIDVQVEPPQFELRFEADHYLLDRVVQNLLTNAAMYTPKGGKVTISFAAPAQVSVFNTGEPIPDQYRKTLFEKYARVTPDSSKYAKGLGLFFCKLVMEAHGGRIGLECTGNGNRFVLDFGG